MQTLIENSAFSLMIVFLVLASALSIYNITIECIFRLRRKITYKTYSYYEQLYLYNTNYINISLIGIIWGLSLILFGLFIWDRVVRLYTIALLPVDLVMGIFLYYELTRKKYNNHDIITFDPYYRDLYRIEKSKNSVLRKINKVEEEFNKLALELMATFREFNAILPNDEKEKEFQDYIDKCNKEFSKNRDELIDYNNKVIKQFNADLNDYLTMGLATDYEIPEFHTIDVQQMFGYIAQFKKTFEAYVSQYSKQSLKKGNLANSQMEAIFNIAIKMNTKFSDEDMSAILETINKKSTKKEEIVSFMLSNSLISEKVIHDAIVQKDWAWCAFEDLIFTQNRKQIIDLYLDIIENNAINSCNKLLNMNTFDQTDILTKVLTSTGTTNSCTQVIKFRIIVHSNDQKFDDEATRYENMAISIRNYSMSLPNDSNRNWIMTICNDSSFYENKEDIVDVYNKIYKKLKDTYAYLNTVLICYYEGVLANNDYLDNAKITNLYLENLLTLNASSLKVFALMVCALVLTVDKDKRNLKLAMDGLRHDPLGKEALANAKTEYEAGKFVLKELLKTKLDKVIPIVNRVESKRMSLNKIKELAA